jgi:fatty-acyl-CoA synthase
VPLNWRLSVPELGFILNDAQPVLLVFHQAMAESAEALMSLHTGMDALCITEQADDPYEAAAGADRVEACPPGARLADVCTILYTSGTTGLPKGALVIHQMTLFNALNSVIPALVGPRTVHLNVLPLFHTGRLNCHCNLALHAGGTVLLMRQFDPAETLQAISDSALGVTYFFGVPANYLCMAQHAHFAIADLSRLVNAGVGGAPISISLLDTWAQRGVALQRGFGMTETGPSVLLLDRQDKGRKPGACGKVLLYAQARLVDAGGREVAVDEVGELQVRGPSITPSYWRQEVLTRESFVDGWFRTGDAARRDDEGFHYIVERRERLPSRGGERAVGIAWHRRGRRGRHRRPEMGRGGLCGGRDSVRLDAGRRGPDSALPQPSGALQGARQGGLREPASAGRDGQGAQAPIACRPRPARSVRQVLSADRPRPGQRPGLRVLHGATRLENAARLFDP